MDQTLIPWLLCAILLLIHLVSKVIHHLEIKDLMNRVMAKDYGELKTWEEKKVKVVLNKDRNNIRL